jgi:glycosyltransferase involved in cell wall biosynthesis
MFEDAGLGGQLHLVGQVANVADYMAAMDLFWLTSASEGLPNVLIEAQMSGTPVVAFNVGGVAETFVDGETGALVAADDSDALVATSVRLLGDKDWLAAAGKQAVRHAQERFSSSAFFEGLSALYAA